MAQAPPAVEVARQTAQLLPKDDSGASSVYWWDRSAAHLEAAVLGHLMARPDAEAGAIIDQLSEEAFSHSHLRKIFHAIRTLWADGLPFGPVEITDRMRAEGTLTDDDPLYLLQIGTSVFAPSLVAPLVAKLRTQALRQLIRDLAMALHDATEAERRDLDGLGALLRTVAEDLDADRADRGLHDLAVFTRHAHAPHR